MWQPTQRRNVRRIALLLTTVAFVGAAAVVTVPTAASGQAALSVDSLDVSDTTETITGDVDGVTLDTTLDYQYDVPDADSRTITLYVAPEGGAYEEVTFAYESSANDAASGSVQLSGDITDHPGISASELDPAVADTESTDLQIKAEIEVERDTGDVVTGNATDTATLTLTDGTALTAKIGGSGDLTVATA